MHPKITEILQQESVLTLCVSANNTPYCANSFYVWHHEKNQLIIIGDKTTRHLQIAQENPQIAGTIYRVKSSMHTEGLQFTGTLLETTDKHIKALYYKQFPFARLAKINFWVICLQYIKCSIFNNGIRKKYEWNTSIEKH